MKSISSAVCAFPIINRASTIRKWKSGGSRFTHRGPPGLYGTTQEELPGFTGSAISFAEEPRYAFDNGTG